jgi:exosortase
MAHLTAVAEPAAGVGSVVRPRPWLRWALACAAVELVVLVTPTVAWLYERWTMSVWHNAHGLFIPPLVAYLVYQELKRTRPGPAAGSGWGFAFLLPALLLHALDAGMHTQLLSALALTLMLPGLALLLLGVERTRAIAFPLTFTLFALPIPLAFTEQIHLLLRQLVTLTTSTGLTAARIPVFVEGTTLHLATGAVEIADACSGFSTLYAAMAVAFLVAYSAPTVRRRVLVLLAAAPLAIAANMLRVFGLVLLAIWQGYGILDTFVHPLSGLLTFALALPAIFWLGTERRGKVGA